VQSVEPGSPAADAGIKGGNADVTINGQKLRAGGDVITAVDGHAVKSMNAVANAVDSHQPGDTIELTLNHGGDERTVTAKLADRPAHPGG
jgi:S1-C subfamily serine protease